MDEHITSGGVHRCTAGGIDRLLLVLRVNRLRSIAQVTLIHPYVEMATGSDIIVNPPASGRQYPLVIQTALRSVVWLADLDSHPVTRVPTEMVDACLSSRASIPTGMATGSGLRGPLDPRWAFKDLERQDLWTLSEGCIMAALGR